MSGLNQPHSLTKFLLFWSISKIFVNDLKSLFDSSKTNI